MKGVSMMIVCVFVCMEKIATLKLTDLLLIYWSINLNQDLQVPSELFQFSYIPRRGVAVSYGKAILSF